MRKEIFKIPKEIKEPQITIDAEEVRFEAVFKPDSDMLIYITFLILIGLILYLQFEAGPNKGLVRRRR